jgi:2-isopropylmalate synthase
MDLGRAYEAVIRVNSQSGKGGVGHTMASAHSFELPRALLLDFAPVVQAITDASGDELSPVDMKDVFVNRYFDSEAPLKLLTFSHTIGTTDAIKLEGEYCGAAVSLQGRGNGPIDALVDAIRGGIESDVAIVSYHEHSMGRSASATAAAYIEGDIVGNRVWGVATEKSTTVAAVKAVVVAFTRRLPPSRRNPRPRAKPRRDFLDALRAGGRESTQTEGSCPAERTMLQEAGSRFVYGPRHDGRAVGMGSWRSHES